MHIACKQGMEAEEWIIRKTMSFPLLKHKDINMKLLASLWPAMPIPLTIAFSLMVAWEGKDGFLPCLGGKLILRSTFSALQFHECGT